jgi:hypothetical protein
LGLPVGKDFNDEGFPTVDAKGADTGHPCGASVEARRFGDSEVGLGLRVGVANRVGAWGNAALDIRRAGTIPCDGFVGTRAIADAQTSPLDALDLTVSTDRIGGRGFGAWFGGAFGGGCFFGCDRFGGHLSDCFG